MVFHINCGYSCCTGRVMVVGKLNSNHTPVVYVLITSVQPYELCCCHYETTNKLLIVCSVVCDTSSSENV